MKSWAKTRCLLFLLACCALTLMTGCSKAKEGDVTPPDDGIILRFAEPLPENNPLAQTSKYFVNLVGAKSNNRIQIKIYYGGELGTNANIIKQLQFGGVALGRVDVCALSEQVTSLRDDFSTLALLPYSETERYEQENRENLEFALQNDKLTLLSILSPSKRCVFSDEIPLNDLDQLKGLRIGIDTSSMYYHLLLDGGFHPVSMSDAETYPSLRNGFIDARETSLAAFATSDVYPFSNHVMILEDITIPSVFVASSETIRKLSKGDRELFRQCAKEASVFGATLLESFERATLDEISQKKQTVTVKWER